MPAESRGPRLWFRKGRKGADGRRLPGYWIIKDDGDTRISTGVRSARGGRPPKEAEEALARYVLSRRQVSRERNRAADEILLADVIKLYVDDIGPAKARPEEIGQRCSKLLSFWGDKRLSDVTGASCRRYAEFRDHAPVARRELEDFRAAINYHRKEGLCREVVEVVLPPEGEPRDRWLTRSEAARLIRAAWRYREVQKGCATGRRSRRHVARFILVALYTRTRAGAVCSASFTQATHTGWIDLDHGVFHRRPKGERETKKRKPPVRLPDRLLGHLRRWQRNGQRYAVEWLGRPIDTGVEKAFARARRPAWRTSHPIPCGTRRRPGSCSAAPTSGMRPGSSV